MKDVLANTEQPSLKMTINPDLKSDVKGPFIQKKLDKMEKILSSLKEPLTEERLQALRKGNTSV